jgi:glyoxylase-like metal-dependent hydrolase (beta-lactamase superfamily II)
MKARSMWALALPCLLAAAILAEVTGPGSLASAQRGEAGDIKVLPVQGNIYMLVGAGANVAASIGDRGVLLVDTGTAAHAETLVGVIRTMTDKPIQFIINTSFYDTHTGGNEIVAKAGRRLVDAQSTQAVVVAHENVLNRMSAPTGSVNPRPVAAWPTDTFFGKSKEIVFNGEAVQIFSRPARSDGDSIVFFRKSDVVVAGDILNTDSFPVIDVAAGGHINGVIEGLNDIIALTVPVNNVEDGTLVVPGSGRLCDELDVAVYRDMVTIIRDRVQDAITRGMTLAQVLADPTMTLEYEGRYGSQTGPWTTAMFLEAIYRNLSAK